MNIKELIKILKTLPGEAEVLVAKDGHHPIYLNTIEVVTSVNTDSNVATEDYTPDISVVLRSY